MNIIIQDFTYFGKDVNQINSELKEMIYSGHIVNLKMNRSTSLSNDMFELMFKFQNHPEFDFQVFARRGNGYDSESRVIIIIELANEDE